MTPPLIRPARAEEYDEVARVWMNSWASTGIDTASDLLLTQLRARVRTDVANGWCLYVADDGGRLEVAGIASAGQLSRPVVRRANIRARASGDVAGLHAGASAGWI
jgi:hypothetical protein